MLATLIDAGLIIGGLIVVLIVAAILGHVASALGALIVVLGYLAAFAFGILQIVRQGNTGQTIGKEIIGIKVLKEETGQPIGAGISIVRQIVHALDSALCYVGYLFPLWDAKRQTFADKIMGTVVVAVPKMSFDPSHLFAPQ